MARFGTREHLNDLRRDRNATKAAARKLLGEGKKNDALRLSRAAAAQTIAILDTVRIAAKSS